MEQAGWEQQEESERERWQMTLGALKRCADAGARVEDLIHIARECGIDPKYITLNADRRTASVG